MIIPRSRLLFAVVFVLVPSAASIMVAPTMIPVTMALAVVLAGVALVDATLGMSTTRHVGAEVPETVRLVRQKPGQFPITVLNPGEHRLVVEMGIPLPDQIESDASVLTVQLAEGVPSSRVSWECTGLERGRFHIRQVGIGVRSPLGCWTLRRILPVDGEIRVYPDVTQARKAASALFLRRGGAGMHAQRMVGHGREFEKLRDYVHGDSYEDIYWKATAKRNRPITKLFQVERTQEVYVAIDTSRTSGQRCGDDPLLERFVTAALLLGLAAQKQGDLFGLLSFSDRVHSFVRSAGGHGHYNSCRDAIYNLQTEPVTPDFGELFTVLRTRIRRRALVVLLTDLGNPLLAENFYNQIRLINRSHVVLVAMIRPPTVRGLFDAGAAETEDDVYARLAGHLTWQELKALGSRLHHCGVHFNLVDEERLGVELISQYMSIKARQLI